MAGEVMINFDIYRNNSPQEPVIVPSQFESLSDIEERDSQEHGHENLAYVANEVAGAASTAAEEIKD